jgi:hypothetical protein
MARILHATQGAADGLCGIYSLVNFMQDQPRIRKANVHGHKVAFAHLLKSAEDLQLLNAERICAGFSADDLVAIFNKTAQRKRIPFKAVELAAVLPTDGQPTSIELMERILDEGGVAIVLRHGDKHWVLAHGLSDDRRIQIKDSGHNPRYRTAQVSYLRILDDGVAILPGRSRLLRKR